ncbi:NADH dehydrogenase-like protein [Pirellula sp. SH-Sr6A]|uniref:NAD(P)/FAD-dependent oxidoreductase n=1 Tax=Pirellula sp. SH-Sr6A TaxID=1632865 RepID=UPI00078BEAF4|nr:NAD(P)/FAD-dependent oxidoreductase [Pirellula sp. SH-Sr6A]AMV30618.1 NADH dehydrogenase-like protein [Pirellula sp. SH-Sr6A]
MQSTAHPELDRPKPNDDRLPQVVIIGGGFAGMMCAKQLKRAKLGIQLIDRRNFHLFQPLLYQVATGGLSPANIAAPLRSIFRRQKNVRVWMGTVVDFDAAKQLVHLEDGTSLPYDYLVLGTGSTHHYFGRDADWESVAPGLKTIEDATVIRRKVLSAFERAEKSSDSEEIARLLTFVIVGGGPTGVEMAGSIAELSKQTMRYDFRSIDPTKARVILVESSKLVLDRYHEKLAKRAGKDLRELGVEVLNETRLAEILPDHVVVLEQGVSRPIPTETVIWAAGVKASPLGRTLAERCGVPDMVDRGGRVAVQPDCSLAGSPNIFVVGDLANFTTADGKSLPGVAPVAIQQGVYVGKRIAAMIQGRPTGPFRYWDKGNMATIGRSHAIVESGKLRLTGKLAWLAWLFIHILYLARFENRVLVLFQWFWNYVTRNRTARLITGGQVITGGQEARLPEKPASNP